MVRFSDKYDLIFRNRTNMINHPSLSTISALKTMWKLCFPQDTAQFINFYFEKVFKTNQSLTLWKNNMLVAFLQIIPYQIKIGNNIYEAGYISGAMTHPEHRQQGYMRQLLDAAFSEMKKLDYTFTFLIPQENRLFDFYAKAGYAKAFPKSVTEFDWEMDGQINSKNVEVFDDLSKIQIEKLYLLYLKLLTQKANVVLKTEVQFTFIIEDLFFNEGYVFYMENEGIAFAVPFEDEIIIKEILYSNEKARQIILNTIKNVFKGEKLFINDFSGRNEYLYGMIKILIPSNFQGEITHDIYMSMMLD
ncbi:MAG: GNAT family N-acetyltransferase [Candidatus Azobacteroides sp.]|nr:GNAT family N-acetyltransferase [Candidatus Azobacteroides sp.]